MQVRAPENPRCLPELLRHRPRPSPAQALIIQPSRPSPPRSSHDLVVLDDLTEMRNDLRYQVAEPRRWIGQLRRSLTAGAIRGSNSVEGYTVSESDAEALAAGEELSAAPDPETEAAVEGYRDALTYVQQTADFEIFRYDHMLLSVLHFMMTKGLIH
jgi:hypothetical protein